jgi:DNA end-binding protein Ku
MGYARSMRSMWKGAISFGLVMIPVKLYAATEQKDIAFRQVHRTDGGRIRFRRVCSVDGEEVPYEDVAKGYELPTGEMVVLTDDDLADLPLPSARSIEVVHFMPAEQLDPILLNRSYFVEPESAGARAYVLLRDSLDRSGKVALTLVALRQRESLATLRTRNGVLVLETLLWPDEIRVPDFPFLDDDIEVRSQELKMAASLIDSMTEDFDPDGYHDNYREALQEVVDAKVEGRQVVQPEGVSAAAEPTSLADALMASLAAARRTPSRAGEITAEAEASPRRAISGGAKTRATRSRSAGAGGSEDGAAEDGSAEASRPRTRPAKTSTAKTSTAKTSTASAGTERAGTAKSGAAGAGTAKSSTTRTSAAKSSTTRTSAAKSSTTRTSAAKTGTARAGAAKAGGASDGGAASSGAAKDEASKTPATRSGRRPAAKQQGKEAETPTTSEQPRGRRRAS